MSSSPPVVLSWFGAGRVAVRGWCARRDPVLLAGLALFLGAVGWSFWARGHLEPFSVMVYGAELEHASWSGPQRLAWVGFRTAVDGGLALLPVAWLWWLPRWSRAGAARSRWLPWGLLGWALLRWLLLGWYLQPSLTLGWFQLVIAYGLHASLTLAVWCAAVWLGLTLGRRWSRRRRRQRRWWALGLVAVWLCGSLGATFAVLVIVVGVVGATGT